MKASGKNVSNRKKLEKDNVSEKTRDIASDLSRLGSFDEILEYLITYVTQTLEAERGSLFLHDPAAHQLYTRVALGNLSREIRIDEQSGIAGWVFMNAEATIVNTPYKDERFNKEVDERTGYQTKSIICVPIFSTGDIPIGVLQVLNKQTGRFTKADLAKIELVASQCASTLNTYALTERMEAQKRREAEFMELVSKLTTELDLSRLLNHVVDAATDMLSCERATVFLNDEKTDELFSMVGAGLGAFEIRLPNNAGISGAVFQSGENVNIPHAYADLRFNPSFDKQTGFFTRSVLCVPILNKEGKRIGVTQALNKIGGPFTEEDEHRIQAFTAQISVGLENAKMFNDMQAVKNYNEAMLHSMSNGVITVDEDGNLKSINTSAEKIVKISSEENLGKPLSDVLDEQNSWLVDQVNKVRETGETENLEDADLITGDGSQVSANIALQPMISGEGENIGALILVEDISSEKRVRSTMSRYMDPQLANQLLEEGDGQAMLGGKAAEATVLFTDIRSFTTIAEALGPQDTVSMLNEYFEIMVACITDAGGMLDKFIGDAMMAGFGVPLPTEDAADAAVRSSIAMISELRKWNADRLKTDKMPVGMGVGVNTDNVVTGNIGSSKRMDFTMIGDGVNLAARLEGSCKTYGAQIIISEFTQTKLKGIYALRELDRIVVKGKTEPVSIFEVLDFHDDETFPARMDVVGHFTEGLAHYRNTKFDDAIKSFKAALDANSEDVPSKLYIERCELFKKSPPPKDWSGEWVMTEK